MVIATGIVFGTLSACNDLSIKQSLSDEEFILVDQDSSTVAFPAAYQGKVMLVGYVYTFCPDICPMITYNMRDVQRALPDETDFMLVSISFDPDRDTPSMLKDYAGNYRLDEDNWRLLTGSRTEVEAALKTLRINTVKTPTRFLDDGRALYFIDHTDRVTLIDRDGNIRKNYMGSEFDPEEVAADVLRLLQDS